MGYVDSWYGRIVDVRIWMFDEGSWHWLSHRMQLDDRKGKLRSVKLLNAARQSLREAEVSQVVECSWTIVAGS